MQPFLDSFFEHWKARTKTQVYGLFAFWWVVFHFEFFYTLLFVDQDKILSQKHMLKNEYLWSEYIRYSDKNFWLWQAAIFIIAAILTFVMIKWLPKFVLNKAYSWERSNELDRQIRKIAYEEQLTEARAKVAKNELNEAQSQKEAEDIKQDISKVWQKDYEKFKKSAYFKDFKSIIESVYERQGRTGVTQYDDGSGQVFSRIPSSVLAYMDSLGLISVNNEKKLAVVALTEKGRYFLSQYPLD